MMGVRVVGELWAVLLEGEEWILIRVGTGENGREGIEETVVDNTIKECFL